MELSSGIKTKCVHTDVCRERIMKLMEEDTSNELQQERIKRRRYQETGDATAGAAVPDPPPNVEMQSEDVGGEPIDLEDGPAVGPDSRFSKAVRFRDTPGDDSAKKKKAGAAAPTVIRIPPPQRRSDRAARLRNLSMTPTSMRT